jgi:hypothetical protein
MEKRVIERRENRRYGVRLPLEYHVSQKGGAPWSGTGLTLDMSTGGMSFRCRKPLPIGAHIEVVVEWPAKHADVYPIELQVTGFVLRSAHGRTGVRMTSRRFRIVETPAETIGVSA